MALMPMFCGRVAMVGIQIFFVCGGMFLGNTFVVQVGSVLQWYEL
jgi:hypothetical protein